MAKKKSAKKKTAKAKAKPKAEPKGMVARAREAVFGTPEEDEREHVTDGGECWCKPEVIHPGEEAADGPAPVAAAVVEPEPEPEPEEWHGLEFERAEDHDTDGVNSKAVELKGKKVICEYTTKKAGGLRIRKFEDHTKEVTKL